MKRNHLLFGGVLVVGIVLGALGSQMLRAQEGLRMGTVLQRTELVGAKGYERAAALTEANLRAMEANTDVDPDFKANQIAGFQAAIKEDRSQQYASAFNGANHSARGGNVAKAKTLLEVAAKDPALSALVAELRRILGGGGFLSE